MSLDLMSPEDAVSGWLTSIGVPSKRSEPGLIAKQIIQHLGGLQNADLIGHEETLKALDKMAGATRIRTGNEQEPEVEEVLSRRSKSFEDWIAILSRRNKEARWRKVELDQLTGRNVLRLGTETVCPHCNNPNWHSLSDANYELQCERCLQAYPFPQGASRSRHWAYRVIGPFAYPKFAEGAYGQVLALAAIRSMLSGMAPMTFSTATKLTVDTGNEVEADYIAWVGEESLGGDPVRPPTLVIGEAKSFGKGSLSKPTTFPGSNVWVLAFRGPSSLFPSSYFRTNWNASKLTSAIRRFGPQAVTGLCPLCADCVDLVVG